MIRKLYGVEMEVPSGKLPGFYAQVIHKIGDGVQVFDRDQQLFIVENEAERDKLIKILDHYNMTGELFTLWLLPDDVDPAAISDHGFTSTGDHSFLYDDAVAFFRFQPKEGQPQDRWAALEQMKEYLLVSLPEKSNETLHVVDKNQCDLLERIARAYKVSLYWEKRM